MKKRIVSLDLVRVFSCICILVVHFNAQVSGWNGTFVFPNSITPNFFLEDRLYLGGIGVSLFFLLSGATLMLTYQTENLRKYYKKRFLNIFPMFWLAYGIATTVDFILYKGLPSGSLKNLILSFCGMDGYLYALGFVGGEFYKVGEWFLGCLLCLYLVFPLLHYAVEKNVLLTAVGCIVIYVGVPLVLAKLGYYCDDKAFFLKIPEILLGMLLIKYDLRNKKKMMLSFAGAGFILAYLLRNMISNASFCTAVCTFLFAILVCIGEKIQKESLQKWIVKFANLTYPIFLIHHWLILKLLRGFDLSVIQRRSVYFLFLIYVLMTILLAQLLDKYTNRITGNLF